MSHEFQITIDFTKTVYIAVRFKWDCVKVIKEVGHVFTYCKNYSATNPL